MRYGTLKGAALGNLIGGGIGSGVLLATRHFWVAAVMLFAGMLGAVCLAFADRWEAEDEEAE